MSVLQSAPVQDLGEYKPNPPDSNWPAYRNPQFLIPEVGRLDAPHQLVTLMNSDPAQTHIIVDRFMQGHELPPGHSKEVDLLVEDIKYFQRQRRTGRTGLDGKLLPSIPIVVVGLPDIPDAEIIKQQRVRTP